VVARVTAPTLLVPPQACFPASVRFVRGGRTTPEAFKLATGGVQRVLPRFCDPWAHQRSAVAADELPDGGFDVLLRQLCVVVAAPDELGTERSQVVAVPAHGRLGQAPVQQVQHERCELLDDLFAHNDVGGLDVPGSGPPGFDTKRCKWLIC